MGVLLGSLLRIAAIAFFVLLITMLVNAAQTKQWGWFVLTLVFSPLAIVYWLFAYQSPKKLREEEARNRNRTFQRERARDEEIAKMREELRDLRASQVKEQRREDAQR